MYTLEMLNQKISDLKKENDNKTMEIARNEAKISVLGEMVLELNSPKKDMTSEDMICVAKKVISEDTQMQRVTKIVSALKDEGFDVDGNALSGKLIRTGKFRINPETKYWEIIDKEDGSEIR